MSICSRAGGACVAPGCLYVPPPISLPPTPPPFHLTLSAAPCLTDNATGKVVPGWRYDAPVTLDFGGAWVTAGASPGRDPTAADLTVALDGVAIPSSEVTLGQHPDREGVYTFGFSAAYWARAQATDSPTVSFPAGAFVSPTHGPLGAFAGHVTLEDCTLPTVVRALLLQTRAYECASGTCDGLGRAAFVLEMDFSEPVFGADGGPVTDANVNIFTVGGAATVTGTYVVQRTGGRRRRLSEAGAMRLSVAVELSAGATGFEVVKVRPRDQAIRDGSGRWYFSHQDADVVTATGNVLEPFPAMSSNAAEASVAVAVGVPVGIFAGVSLLIVAFFLWQRRRMRRLKKAEVRISPRGWGTWGSWKTGSTPNTNVSPDALKMQQKKPRGKPASTNALAIANHYEWLRNKKPQVELTGLWIDTLADATVDTLRGAQPACALVPGVLRTAHVVHSKLRGGGVARDDLEALRTLGKLLRDGPPPLPKSLQVAAISLDTSAADVIGKFGSPEATRALQQVREDRALSRLVA